jgi:hypothetical protein
MSLYTVSYILLKSQWTDLGLTLRHTSLYESDGVTIRGETVYAARPDYVLEADLEAGTDDFTDFEDNLKPHSTPVDSESDVLAVYGVTPIDSEGCAQVSLTKGMSGLNAVCVVNVPVSASNLTKSWQVTALPNTVTIRDIYITGDLVGPLGRCYIVGGKYKCRTDAMEGSSINFAMVDRDDVTGYFAMFGLHRTKMVLSNVSGTIGVGDTVTGVTSGQTSKVLEVVDASTVEVTFANGPFTDGESVTFSGGATATCDDWVEGDVLYLAMSVEDEWLEGEEEGEFKPGDSRALAAGLYFRVIAFNTSPTDNLRMKVTLEMGKE